LTRRDQQAIKFDERNIIFGRNFLTKLWNIARFVYLNIQGFKIEKIKTPRPKSLADEWILSRLNSTISFTAKQIENFEFGKAERGLYNFVWKEFADVYLEISKFHLKDEKLKKNTQEILLYSLINILKLLHPFVPFVTEKIWLEKFRGSKKLLMVEEWPKIQKKFISKKVEGKIYKIKNQLKELQKQK